MVLGSNTMSRVQDFEQKLNLAFHKSGMTPEQFFDYLVTTRRPMQVHREDLSFKILINYQEDGIEWDDLEWIIYIPKTGKWILG